MSLQRDLGPALPAVETSLTKKWSTKQKGGATFILLLASWHSLCLAPSARHPGVTNARARSAVFWISWAAMLANAVAVCISDPRDPGGQDAEVRCGMCKMAVRKNSKHCYTCKHCVCDFDHHCTWLNICIGRRNYVRFSTLVGLWLLVNGAFIVDAGSEARRVYKERGWCKRSALLSGLCCAVAPGFAMGADLLCFHLKLLLRRTTTYEYYKRCQPEVPLASDLWIEVDAPNGDTVSTFATTAFNEQSRRRGG